MIEIGTIELLALKKLAVICGALAQKLPASAAREQRALTSVLLDVIQRAEISNAKPVAPGEALDGRSNP